MRRRGGEGEALHVLNMRRKRGGRDSRGIEFCGCWGAIDTSPVLGVDSKIVWLLEGSFQLFLIGNFSSQGVRLADGKGKEVGVDKRDSVVVVRSSPKSI